MITTQQMKELEDYAESQGISTLELMENAGKGLVEAVKKKFELPENTRVIVFCGNGNNAGDGFVAARYFAEDFPVIVLFFGKKEKLPEEAQRNYEKLKNPILVMEIKNKEELEKIHIQKELPLLLIDALLGTGLKGEIREPMGMAMDLFNQLEGVKVAVDIPSGINPDTGERAEKVCEVDLIVSFHDLKAGLTSLRNKTVVVDIGIPKENSETPKEKIGNGKVDLVIE